MVSVIMPVYNESEYVRNAVESILNQSFRNFEFIIIDDGSTDNTLDIIKNYKDDRIIVFESNHQGIVAQLNYGISQAKYQFIARMDGDDISHPHRLEKQVLFIHKNSDIDIVGTNVIYINNYGRSVIKKEFPENSNSIEYMMPILCSICHPTIMIKKEVLIEMGGYSNIKYVEDYDLFLRMLTKKKKMYNIQEYLHFYRFEKSYLKSKKLAIQDLISLKLGERYIQENSPLPNDYDYFFRLALANYYRGKLHKSRSYLLKSLVKSPKRIFSVLRYIPLTILGDKITAFLRRIGLLSGINMLLKRVFGYETQFSDNKYVRL